MKKKYYYLKSGKQIQVFFSTFLLLFVIIFGQVRGACSSGVNSSENKGLPLSGTYYVGHSIGDEQYLTLEAAIDDLISNGVSDKVIFSISPGTYNRQYVIPEISGMSKTNYVAFSSRTGDPNDVILTYTVNDFDHNYIVKLDGADYLQFFYLTFKSGTNLNYGTLMVMENGASNNDIAYCIFDGTENGSSISHSLLYSKYANTLDEGNTIVQNTFKNGYCGIYFSGIDNANMEKGNVFSQNNFNDQYEAGIQLHFQDSCKIEHDSIRTSSTNVTPYGIYLKNCQNEFLNCNNVEISSAGGDGGYGIYLEDCLGDADNKGNIINNFVSLFTNSGINTMGITLRNSPYRNIIYNTVNITGSNTGSQVFKAWEGSDNYTTLNNIFSNMAGGAALSSSSSTNFTSDYNDFYTTGSVLVNEGANAWNTIADLKAGASYDAHSVSVDPEFVSDTNMHIYHANEYLDGAGIPVDGINKDIDFDTRDASNPDIGADEYNFVNDQNDLLSFSLSEQAGDATINSEAHTISIEVVYGTNLTTLVATFSISNNATVAIDLVNQVSGTTENDFSSPVSYVVTAEDGSYQDWLVTVSVAENTENDILTFSFPEQTGTADINSADHTVDIELVQGTVRDGLIATFTLSVGAKAMVGETEQVSGTTQNNFDSDLQYKIVAEDGSIQNWTLSVTVEPFHGYEILTYSLPGQIEDAVINNELHEIDIEVPQGTDVSSLVANFTISDGASASVNGTLQESGITVNDFSNTVVYSIMAEDGNEQNWVVNVVEIATAISNFKEDRFLLYPNPCEDFIHIKSNDIKDGISEIEILSVTGKTISSAQVQNFGGMDYTINFRTDMNPGFYLIRISIENQFYMQKILVK